MKLVKSICQRCKKSEGWVWSDELWVRAEISCPYSEHSESKRVPFPIPLSNCSMVMSDIEYTVGVDPASIMVITTDKLPRRCMYRAEHLVSQT